MPQHTTVLNSITGRVRLVPPRAEDDEAMSILRSHPITLQYLQFLPTKFTIEDARTRRESRIDKPELVDFHIHVVGDDGTTTFAGSTGIFRIDEMHKSCEVGILISPDIHRGGFGTEALTIMLSYVFDDRKLHRATFETGEDNLLMRAWLERVLEAKLEATRRECWSDGRGKYINVTSYSILDWEWAGGVKKKLERSLLARKSSRS